MVDKIEIKDKRPIMDYVVQVAKELTKYNCCEIEAPLSNAGKIVDLEHIVYRLDPSVDKRVVIEFSNGATKKINLVRSEENPLIRITLKENLSLDDFEEELYRSCLISGPSGSISAWALKKRVSSRKNFLERALSKYLPKAKDNIVIRMGYMSLSPFPLFTRYEDFELLEKVNEVEIYPVSVSPEYEMDESSFNFFRDPIFWDAWSQYHSHCLNILSGKDTLKEIAEHHKEDLDHLREHIEKAKEGVFYMINLIINCKDEDMMLKEFNCPPKYAKYYLRKSLKTLNYIVLDSWDKKDYTPIKNLVESYNNYVDSYRPRWSKIENIEQFVRAVRLSKRKKRVTDFYQNL